MMLKDGLIMYIYKPRKYKIIVICLSCYCWNEWSRNYKLEEDAPVVSSYQQPSPIRISPGSHIFVCSHNSRDKRCGYCGPILIKKFKEETELRGLENVSVTACSHVGGHKYAGNLIIYSVRDSKVSGHWYGYVHLMEGNGEVKQGDQKPSCASTSTGVARCNTGAECFFAHGETKPRLVTTRHRFCRTGICDSVFVRRPCAYGHCCAFRHY